MLRHEVRVCRQLALIEGLLGHQQVDDVSLLSDLECEVLIDQVHQQAHVFELQELIEYLPRMETHLDDEFVFEESLVIQVRTQVGNAAHFFQQLKLCLRHSMLRLFEEFGELLPEALGAVLELLCDHLKVQHNEHGKQDLLQVAAVLVLLSVDHLQQ